MECQPHIVLIPFMSKSHIIPLLRLARLLRRRRLTVTIFTTPVHKPFITAFLSDVDVSIISLPFPSNIPGIPKGVESTEKFPSMSLFYSFCKSTKLLQPHFEESLKTLSNVKLMVSDFFLHWTLQSANKFNIPRLAFYVMNFYATTLSIITGTKRLFAGPDLDDEPITVPDFPWINLTIDDMPHPFNERHPSGQDFDHIMEIDTAAVSSHGLLFNSFYELEPLFVDYYRANVAPRAWPIGPLCLAEPKKKRSEGEECKKPNWVKWMDQKYEQGVPVLYIAFGTQVEVSSEQMKEITVGLERSEVSFLWVVRPNQEQDKIVDGFVEKVKEKGLVVKDWVDQIEVLDHEAVRGFLSQCGWNSVTESICACVPILAWPMMAEQYLNAKMVVEEIKMGIRVETCDGSVRGFVKADGLEKTVRELMKGEIGKSARKKAKEVGEDAKKAMEEGGSSWIALESLLDEFKIGKSAKITT